MNARTIIAQQAAPVSERAEADHTFEDARREPVSLRGVARMIAAPKNFLARFSREELEAIMRASERAPEVGGCGD